MSRTNRSQRNHNVNRSATERLTREIERQLASLPDNELYALTFAADRVTRRVADRLAHARAERYAETH